MKKLPVPNYNDIECTRGASTNKKMSSYPHLKNEFDSITQAYRAYDISEGNTLELEPVDICEQLSDALKTHYSSEPKCFSFIPDLRSSSPSVCPMCGSLNTGTLDHLFPQSRFPEFAVFSKNLVPACDCNSKRKDTYRGVDAESGDNVRVLHPYYDDCLQTRQIYFCIAPSPSYPMATFDLRYINNADPLLPSIKFHVENIILPSGIKKRLESMWTSLDNFPSDQIQTLPECEPINMGSLEEALRSALRRHDRQKGTPNNWESIFIHSLLQSNSAMEYIVERHNQVIEV